MAIAFMVSPVFIAIGTPARRCIVSQRHAATRYRLQYRRGREMHCGAFPDRLPQGRHPPLRPPSARAVAMHNAGRRPLPERSMKSFTSPYRCRCGSHVGTPPASVSASMSRYHTRRSRKPAGPTISPATGTVSTSLSSQRILQRGHISQAAARSSGATSSTFSIRPSVRVERIGDGFHERRYCFEQRARLLEQR